MEVFENNNVMDRISPSAPWDMTLPTFLSVYYQKCTMQLAKNEETRIPLVNVNYPFASSRLLLEQVDI